MNHTTDHSLGSTEPRIPTRRGSRSRLLAVGVLATAAATLAASLGLSSPDAQADPGDTFVRIGSSQLIQSEDLSAIQIPLDTASVELNRDQDFSSCLGEGNPWTAVLPGSATPIAAHWTNQHRRAMGLSEWIAQAESPRKARGYAARLLNKAVRACQGEHDGYDFHYGPTTSSRVGSGKATWAVSYRGGNPQPDGGVVVFRKGSNVGFIQLTGTRGPFEQTMESVAKVAVHRLIYSS